MGQKLRFAPQAPFPPDQRLVQTSRELAAGILGHQTRQAVTLSVTEVSESWGCGSPVLPSLGPKSSFWLKEGDYPFHSHTLTF